MFNNAPLLQLVNSLHFSCRCRRQPVDLSPLPRNVVPKVRDAPGAGARHQLETTLQHFPLQLERHQLLRMAPNDSCRGRKQRQRQKQQKQKQQKHQHQQSHHQKHHLQHHLWSHPWYHRWHHRWHHQSHHQWNYQRH